MPSSIAVFIKRIVILHRAYARRFRYFWDVPYDIKKILNQNSISLSLSLDRFFPRDISGVIDTSRIITRIISANFSPAEMRPSQISLAEIAASRERSARYGRAINWTGAEKLDAGARTLARVRDPIRPVSPRLAPARRGASKKVGDIAARQRAVGGVSRESSGGRVLLKTAWQVRQL